MSLPCRCHVSACAIHIANDALSTRLPGLQGILALVATQGRSDRVVGAPFAMLLPSIATRVFVVVFAMALPCS